SAGSSKTAAPRQSPPGRKSSPASCWPPPRSACPTSATSTLTPARSRTSPPAPTRRSRRRSADPGTRSSTTTAPGRPPVSSRPLGRSPDPEPGESLNGFLLRLSCRLHVSPARLAQLGIVTSAARGLSRRLLLDTDPGVLAQLARLSVPEAAG